MSDWSGKYKPLLERIASLGGRSTGIPSSGGGAPVVTDHDIANAVAMARQMERKNGKKYDTPVPGCVRSELLLLKWGSRTDCMMTVVKSCVSAIDDAGIPVRALRCAAVLAAQVMAGKKVGQESVENSAWAADVPMAVLLRQVGRAEAWMQGELSEAERSYIKWLRRPDAQKAA